jgi:hypothetical protein
MSTQITSYVNTRREVVVTLGDGSKFKWDSMNPDRCVYFTTYNTLGFDTDDIDKLCEGLQELKRQIGGQVDGWHESTEHSD